MDIDNLNDILSKKYNFDIDTLRLIIESIPANIFFKDTHCRYQTASHVCAELNAGDIIGKTDLEIQADPKLGKLFYEDDLKIINTRKGSHYISEMNFGDDKYYYDIAKEPVIDAEGNLYIKQKAFIA